MKCPKHPLYKALKPPKKRPGRVAKACICRSLYEAAVVAAALRRQQIIASRKSAPGAYTSEVKRTA